eukprot:scaffold29383_cov102-Isochrysis_galbana.AAC.6
MAVRAACSMPHTHARPCSLPAYRVPVPRTADTDTYTYTYASNTHTNQNYCTIHMYRTLARA